MNTERFTFNKEERLCSKKLIDKVFEGKKVVHFFPFSIYYLSCNADMSYPAQVLFAVSKKNFKKAVDRNHIKRLCKESYRMQKTNFYAALQTKQEKLAVVFVYNHNVRISYLEMNTKMNAALERLLLKLK